MLLVVVDQPRIRRRGDDAVVRTAELELASVAVENDRRAPRVAHFRERADARSRVREIPTQKLLRALDGAACPPVLVTPVGLALRRAREVEIEVCREPGGAGGTGQDDA